MCPVSQLLCQWSGTQGRQHRQSWPHYQWRTARQCHPLSHPVPPPSPGSSAGAVHYSPPHPQRSPTLTHSGTLLVMLFPPTSKILSIGGKNIDRPRLGLWADCRTLSVSGRLRFASFVYVFFGVLATTRQVTILAMAYFPTDWVWGGASTR